MKVLFFFNTAINSLHFRKNLINTFVLNGHEVTVVLNKSLIEKAKEVLNPKVNYYITEAFSGTSTSILGNIRLYWRIKAMLRELSPDILFLINVKPIVYGASAAAKLGIKNVFALITGLGYAFIEDNNVKRYTIRKILEYFYKRSLKTVKHVFFQNNDDLTLFLNKKIVNLSQAILVNGTGVDLSEYVFDKNFPDTLTFLMASRLVREKGIYEYLEACKNLKNKYPHIRFLLAGDTCDNPSSISQEELKNLSNYVEYVGYCKEMYSAFQRCSVFVYPSYYREGVPRAILEALSTGRPIITTDNVGCRETVIDQKNGFRVAIKNAKALEQAMENFIMNPHLLSQMGSESRKLAESKFDIEQINHKIYTSIQGCSK